MINDNFDQSTRINMELALERACRCLPEGFDSHEMRKGIAAGILACARAGHSHLDELSRAADLTAARLVNEVVPEQITA